MCTVSIVPHSKGVRVVCNRDEQLTRAPALAPHWRRAGQRRAVYPVDPDGRGTWIGVNDAGVVLTLLNRCHGRTAMEPRAPLSRGLVVPSLLRHARLASALDAALALDLHRFRPFRLIALQRRELAVLTSDGPIREIVRLPLDRPLVFASSSLGDRLVEPPRRRLFRSLVLRRDWLAGQMRFHDHQWSDRPAISVRMARPDARTVSRTTVDLDSGLVRLTYTPLP